MPGMHARTPHARRRANLLAFALVGAPLAIIVVGSHTAAAVAGVLFLVAWIARQLHTLLH